MSLRQRLKRLEQVQREDSAITLLCVNEAGLVLDDDSDQIRPWVGKHYGEVPGTPKILWASTRSRYSGGGWPRPTVGRSRDDSYLPEEAVGQVRSAAATEEPTVKRLA